MFLSLGLQNYTALKCPAMTSAVENQFCLTVPARLVRDSTVLTIEESTVRSYSYSFDHLAKFLAPGTFFLNVLFYPRLYLVLCWTLLGFGYLTYPF